MTEGRLYRSGGAEGATAQTAIPALTKDQRAKLKTTTITETVVAEPVIAAPAIAEPIIPAPLAAPIVAESIVVDAASIDEVSGSNASDAAPSTERAGMTASQVWMLICGVTFVVALIDGFFHRGSSEASALTIITGIALIASTVVAALLVRPGDRWYPVIVPPIAFLIATLTAGQFGLSSTGSLMIREGLMIFTTLGRNAIWIFIAVIAAGVIGVVKSRLTK